MERNSTRTCFFERIGPCEFAATPLVEGAWNRTEQHIAPALGLIAHAIKTDQLQRREDVLRLGRLSYDILGTIPIGTVTIDVTVLRPGRTIELVEARRSYEGRPVVLARTWLMQVFDTEAIAGTSFPALPPPEAIPAWDMSTVWAGACIGSMELRREDVGIGRARAWLRTNVGLLCGEDTSPTADMLALADIANGIAARMPPQRVAFPNLDLTIHLLRSPVHGWLGLDTTVSFGPNGIGLTHSIMHDREGVLLDRTISDGTAQIIPVMRSFAHTSPWIVTGVPLGKCSRRLFHSHEL